MHQGAVIELELFFRVNLDADLLECTDCWRLLIACKSEDSTKARHKVTCIKILDFLINVLYCIVDSLCIWFNNQKHIVKGLKFAKDCSNHLEDFLILHFSGYICKSWYINQIDTCSWSTPCLINSAKMLHNMLRGYMVHRNSGCDWFCLHLFVEIFLCHFIYVLLWVSFFQ